MTANEMRNRGWKEVDVVFVTGDAYVDHPSFAAAILTRVLEREGYRVGILSQPDWHNCKDWKRFGKPRLFFAISAGNMDSMVNHYTANKKVRNDDAYSPGGKIGLRPDRATKAYCQRAREAYKSIPVIAGGVEASLRRLAHYDYWSDTVRRSILLDAKADMIAYGMGEEAIVEIANRLSAGQTVKQLRNMRGIAYACGASETVPENEEIITIPSFEEIKEDRRAFARATRLIHGETNPHNARSICQYHGKQAVICTPPRMPVSEKQLDSYYDLPYSRRPHPAYKKPIPAYEMIKNSITIMRGCFGGCSFCSITLHQGRIIQSRSEESILQEIRELTADPEFKKTVSDLGGPTANMYRMHCTRPEIQSRCRRLSCIHPTICKLLDTSHDRLVELMRCSRKTKGIKKVFVASGVRTDLARLSPEYMDELVQHHVGGYLKVAPEHTDPRTLSLMHKPCIEDFLKFSEAFRNSSQKAGKKQFLIPYFIASHPGSTIEAMIDLALFLKKNDYRPEQVQDFIPAPMDIATCMYYTGLDPASGEKVYVARHNRDRKYQRALMQYFKPENYFLVRQALLKAGRRDLIGNHDRALIPANPPAEAVAYRHKGIEQGNRFCGKGKRVSSGYRPGRTTHKRQDRRRRNRDA